MSDQKKKFDVDKAMRMLAEADQIIDSVLTAEERQAVAALGRRVDSQGAEGMYAAVEHVQAQEDFDLLATADALEGLAAKVRAVVEVKQAEAYQQALDLYYAAEELSKDPAHAHLTEHVERLRAAHLRQYGKPIPPKKGQ